MKMLVRLVIALALAAVMTAAPAVADKGGVPHNGGGNDQSQSTQSPPQSGDDVGTDEAGTNKSDDQGDDNDNQGEDEQGDDNESNRSSSHSQSTGESKTKSTSHAQKSHSKSTSSHSEPSKTNTTSSHGHAGKTTICHATHSETNPYVKNTVSNNAIPAHDRHQDNEDIIPANGDCPGGTARTHVKSHSTESKSKSHSNESKANSGAEHGKTTICHSTASVTNPFVRITISNNALNAHRRHHDGRDVIPANGDCPAGTQPVTQEQGDNGHGDENKAENGNGNGNNSGNGNGNAENTAASSTPGTGSSPASAITKGAEDIAGAEGNGGATGGGVLGQHAQGGTRGASSTGTSGPSGSLAGESASGNGSGNSGLPFTGWDIGIVAALGAAMLLAGTALRRARRSS